MLNENGEARVLPSCDATVQPWGTWCPVAGQSPGERLVSNSRLRSLPACLLGPAPGPW